MVLPIADSFNDCNTNNISELFPARPSTSSFNFENAKNKKELKSKYKKEKKRLKKQKKEKKKKKEDEKDNEKKRDNDDNATTRTRIKKRDRVKKYTHTIIGTIMSKTLSNLPSSSSSLHSEDVSNDDDLSEDIHETIEQTKDLTLDGIYTPPLTHSMPSSKDIKYLHSAIRTKENIIYTPPSEPSQPSPPRPPMMQDPYAATPTKPMKPSARGTGDAGRGKGSFHKMRKSSGDVSRGGNIGRGSFSRKKKSSMVSSNNMEIDNELPRKLNEQEVSTPQMPMQKRSSSVTPQVKTRDAVMEEVRDIDLTGSTYVAIPDDKEYTPTSISDDITEESSYEEYSTSSEYEEEPKWNLEYQQLRSKLKKISQSKDKITIHQNIAELVADFTYVATNYAKIIINEVNISNDKKTIKTTKLGGEVGGDKYVVHDIIFKLTTPVTKASLDVEQVIKIAGHELKALNFIIDKCHTRFCFPLMTLIDYLGYRVLAVAKLPVDNRTIRYGSPNAGETIYSDIDNEIYTTMKQIAVSCNLGENKVRGHHLYTPIDLECHRGYDNRIYGLDFSRLFPPTYYNRNKDSKDLRFLYELFRPEFVQAFPKPLVSDSISPFIGKNLAYQTTNDITEATKYLKQRIIPSFANILAQQKANIVTFNQLIPAVHRQGINIRYLGLIYEQISLLPGTDNKQWLIFLLVEMTARAHKILLRRTLKKTSSNYNSTIPRKIRLISSVVTYLNEAFSYKSCETFWKKHFILITDKFKGCNIQFNDFCKLIRENNHFHQFIFIRLQELVGIEFTSTALEQFKMDLFFNSKIPFHFSHIKDIVPVIKNLVIMENTKGIVLKREAKKFPENRNELLNASRIAFESALQSNPSDITSILHLADVLYKLNNYNEARDYFSLAMRMTNILLVKYKCARFCHKIDATETAIGYKEAILTDTNDYKTWYYFTKYLIEKQKTQESIINALCVTYFLSNTKQELEKTKQLILEYSNNKDIWKFIQKSSPIEVSQYWENKFKG